MNTSIPDSHTRKFTIGTWLLYFLIYNLFFIIYLIAWFYLSGETFNNFYLAIYFFLFLYGILLAFIWKKVGQWMLKKTVTNDIVHHRTDRTISRFGAFLYFVKKKLFINFNTESEYFIAPDGNQTSVTSVRKMFFKAYPALLLNCLGVAELLRYIFWFIFGWGNNLWEIDDIYPFLAVLLSPVLVAIFIPVIWTLNDANIKEFNPDHNIDNIGTDWKNLWQGTFGLGGLISLVQVWIYSTIELGGQEGWDTLRIIFETTAGILSHIFLIAGVSLIGVVLYFNFVHNGMVDHFRDDVGAILPTKNVQLVEMT